MSATIISETGAEAGRQFAIEEEVFRIGSGPTCKLRVSDPGVAAHAATVEYRQGGYLLHNRSGQALQVEGRPLADRGCVRWTTGQRLHLADQVVLRLDIAGDPAPARAVRRAQQAVDLGTDAPESAPEPLTAAQPSAGHGRKGPLIVIGLCGLLMLALLAYQPNTSGESAAPEKETEGIPELVRQLHQQDTEIQPGGDAPWYLLQTAYAAELRGNPSQAKRSYVRLLDLLRQRQKTEGVFASELDEKVWNAVSRRLRQ